MRQFVVVGHDAPTTDDFSLDDLPGAGRLDVLCRCVTAALLLSHGIREGVEISLVLDGELTVRFDGATVRRLNPDERSTAALIRTALAEREQAVGHVEVETSPGVHLSRRGLDPVLDAAADAGTVVRLHEDGYSAGDVPVPHDPVFVLSDDRDLSDEEASLVDDIADRRLRLGPERLHADDAITVAHHWLDTRGYERF